MSRLKIVHRKPEGVSIEDVEPGVVFARGPGDLEIFLRIDGDGPFNVVDLSNGELRSIEYNELVRPLSTTLVIE